jgi:hypothetical protein
MLTEDRELRVRPGVQAGHPDPGGHLAPWDQKDPEARVALADEGSPRGRPTSCSHQTCPPNYGSTG